MLSFFPLNVINNYLLLAIDCMSKNLAVRGHYDALDFYICHCFCGCQEPQERVHLLYRKRNKEKTKIKIKRKTEQTDEKIPSSKILTLSSELLLLLLWDSG